MSGDAEAILRDWYANQYSSVAATANGSFAHRFMHRSMEAPFTSSATFRAVLEVGSNIGEHIPFVQHAYDLYVASDLHEPRLPAPLAANPRIVGCRCDAAALPFAPDSFDRVISTCVMHHVVDPMQVASELRRVTRVGGIATLMIPTDPSIAYRAAVRVTSYRNARRAGLADRLALVQALDHRNHYRSIAKQLQWAFQADDVKITFFPFRSSSIELNMFTVWQVRVGR